MASLFIETPVSLVREDTRYPDRDTRHIYDHLKHGLSLPSLFPLPAIHVILESGNLVLTGGHKYLKAARELGRPRIRAILPIESATASSMETLSAAGVIVVPKDELEQEVETQLVRGYHVYFFEKPLSAKNQALFLSNIAGFFETLDSPLFAGIGQRVLGRNFPFDANCAEFEALFPVGDKSWFPNYLKVSQEFSRGVVRIVSFQGARFPGDADGRIWRERVDSQQPLGDSMTPSLLN